MENPLAWSKAEVVIAKAMSDWQAAVQNGLVGRSQVKAIADSLEEAGLLTTSEEAASSAASDKVQAAYVSSLVSISDLTGVLASLEKTLFEENASLERRSTIQAAAETLGVIRRTIDREKILWDQTEES